MKKLWIAMIALALAAPFSAFSQEKGDRGDSGQMKKDYERKGKKMGRRHRRGGCKLAERVARKRGDRCLRVKKDNKRKRCFDRVGNYLERKFGERCMSKLEPIRRDLERRESERYGKNSFGDMKGDHRGNDQMKGSMGSSQGSKKRDDPMMSKKIKKPRENESPNCDSIENNIRKKGEKCIAIKNQRKRRICFHKLLNIYRPYIRECREVEYLFILFKGREMKEHPNADDRGIGDVGKEGYIEFQDRDKDYKQFKKLCRIYAAKVRRKGHPCLRNRTSGKRRSCFGKIGSWIRRVRGGRCEGVFEPVMQIFMEEERVIYPHQESGIL